MSATELGLDIGAAFPEVFLACAGMALLMLGVFSVSSSLVSLLALASILIASLYSVFMPPETGTAFGGLFISNAFTEFAKVLIGLGSALAIVMSRDFNRREAMDSFEFPVLMLFATLGMMMMVSANDMMALYLGLELQSLSLYVLAAYRRDTLRSSEAGLKYFVLGALSSGLLLYGCSLVYGFAGVTGFEDIGRLFASGQAETGAIVGLVFIAAALAFKVSAAPFHMWTPDVYEGAPTPVTAFFAVAPKIAAVALFVRVLVEPFGGLVDEWRQVIVFVSALSMAIGAVAAIAQTSIKRLMAYSSIGHIGYAFVGLAAGSESGIRGVLIYLAIYLVMNVGTFACILSMRRNGRAVEEISDLSGLSRSHPFMAMALAAFMFSMAGIPPLAGFWGKLYVFKAAIDEGLVALAVFGVVASVVSCFYYIRIVKVMYFDEADDPLDKRVPRELTAITLVAAVLVIFFSLRPEDVVSTASAAAATLFGS